VTSKNSIDEEKATLKITVQQIRTALKTAGADGTLKAVYGLVRRTYGLVFAVHAAHFAPIATFYPSFPLRRGIKMEKNLSHLLDSKIRSGAQTGLGTKTT
jgi:hypothetical protein